MLWIDDYFISSQQSKWRRCNFLALLSLALPNYQLTQYQWLTEWLCIPFAAITQSHPVQEVARSVALKFGGVCPVHSAVFWVCWLWVHPRDEDDDIFILGSFGGCATNTDATAAEKIGEREWVHFLCKTESNLWLMEEQKQQQLQHHPATVPVAKAGRKSTYSSFMQVGSIINNWNSAAKWDQSKTHPFTRPLFLNCNLLLTIHVQQDPMSTTTNAMLLPQPGLGWGRGRGLWQAMDVWRTMEIHRVTIAFCKNSRCNRHSMPKWKWIKELQLSNKKRETTWIIRDCKIVTLFSMVDGVRIKVLYHFYEFVIPSSSFSSYSFTTSTRISLHSWNWVRVTNWISG